MSYFSFSSKSIFMLVFRAFSCTFLALGDPDGPLPSEECSWMKFVQHALSSALVVANQIHRSVGDFLKRLFGVCF